MFATISSFFSAAYVIPKKIAKQSTLIYTLFMCLGFFAASVVAFILHKLLVDDPQETLLHPILLLSALGGVVWFAGSLACLLAIDRLGLSQAAQWKNLQGPIAALLQLIVLAEYRQANAAFILMASLAILLSAMLFSSQDRTERAVDRRGILYALFAAVCFGVNTTIQKHVTNHGLVYAQMLCYAAFTFLTALAYLLARGVRLPRPADIAQRDNALGILGGVVFYLASFFTTLSFKYIPGSIAYTIVQLNVVWSVLIGIVVFHEVDVQKNRWKLLLEFLLVLAGVVLLLMAQR